MREFLRENWKWIVVPIALVIVALLLMVIFGGGKNTSAFQYNDY
jgi:hypothetical protein